MDRLVAAALDEDTVKNVITIVSAVFGWLVAKYFSGKKDDQKATWEKALEAASSIMETLAHVADPAMTVDRFETQCRGVAAVQLAKFGYVVDHLPFAIAAARDAAVYAAVKMFVSLHPSPKTLEVNGLAPKIP